MNPTPPDVREARKTLDAILDAYQEWAATHNKENYGRFDAFAAGRDDGRAGPGFESLSPLHSSGLLLIGRRKRVPRRWSRLLLSRKEPPAGRTLMGTTTTTWPTPSAHCKDDLRYLLDRCEAMKAVVDAARKLMKCLNTPGESYEGRGAFAIMDDMEAALDALDGAEPDEDRATREINEGEREG